MTLQDFSHELENWKLSRYKVVNFCIGLAALLIYEFLARPIYRPYIYKHQINDLHLADTIGNSLGTFAAIFVPLALLTSSKKLGNPLIKLITLTLVIYEIGQPLLGKKADFWDILATVITGLLSFWIYNAIFSNALIE